MMVLIVAILFFVPSYKAISNHFFYNNWIQKIPWGGNSKHKKLDFNSIKKDISIETYSLIFSTPALHDLNNDGYLDLSIGTISAGAFAYDGKSGKQIYAFPEVKEVIAPPLFIDVNEDAIYETMWIEKKGRYYVVNNEGEYLYTSKQKDFYEEIIAKPALSIDRSLIYLAGMQGSVWCIEKTYGLVQWVYRDQTTHTHEEKNHNSIFAAPILVKINADDTVLDVVVVNTSGTLFSLDGAEGRLLWKVSINSPVKASMTYGKFFPSSSKQKQIALFDLNGNIHLISTKGKILHSQKLSQGFFITSPVSVDLLSLGYDQIINTSSEGTVLLYDPTTHRIIKQFTPSSTTDFRSSPVLCYANSDKILDLILISVKKELFILDGSTFKLIHPIQHLQSAVTSTPLVADIDKNGSSDLVIACENGVIVLYQLTTTHSKQNFFWSFSKKPIPVKEFLLHPQNHNNMNP